MLNLQDFFDDFILHVPVLGLKIVETLPASKKCRDFEPFEFEFLLKPSYARIDDPFLV